MVVLTSSYIILCALVNGVFYVYRTPSISNMYICFDENTIKNDSWPSEYWKHMTSYVLNRDTDAFGVRVPKNATQYKLRVMYKDRSFDDTVWKYLNNTPPSSSASSVNRQNSVISQFSSVTYQLSTVTFVAGYIAACSTFLLILHAYELWRCHFIETISTNYAT